LLLTGLRRGELLKAKWSDVDWKQRTLLIPKTKNGEALLAPLSHAAISRLKDVAKLQDNPYMLNHKDQKTTAGLHARGALYSLVVGAN
jgi:integrase